MTNIEEEEDKLAGLIFEKDEQANKTKHEKSNDETHTYTHTRTH